MRIEIIIHQGEFETQDKIFDILFNLLDIHGELIKKRWIMTGITNDEEGIKITYGIIRKGE